MKSIEKPQGISMRRRMGGMMTFMDILRQLMIKQMKYIKKNKVILI